MAQESVSVMGRRSARDTQHQPPLTYSLTSAEEYDAISGRPGELAHLAGRSGGTWGWRGASTAMSLDSCGQPEEYSTEVPQQARNATDSGARSGTVTCTDGRGWTWCLRMACKRSGVRIPVAPRKPPGQDPVVDPSGWLSRSPDRHLTVVLGTGSWHWTARIGSR
jgi:hypothetical protein